MSIRRGTMCPPVQVLVIGGGFFGLTIAAHCARAGWSVVLAERADELMTLASYNNQARVHNGYHYPRSVLTALRSRINFPRFVESYRDCVVSDFTKIYAVPRTLSKVTATQFRRFMERIGAPIQPAPAKIKKLFSLRIEDAFACIEYAFDAVKLKAIAEQRAREAGVEIRRFTEVMEVREDSGEMQATLASAGEQTIQPAKLVFNCTYSRINVLLRRSGLPVVAFKQELTEMCLTAPPPEMVRLGVTVMCGPFFSLMPFPPRGLHTLSHVRYTPHFSWKDDSPNDPDPMEVAEQNRTESNFCSMKLDATRYLPSLTDCVQHGSLWEVKTILPRSEGDDSRPILFAPCAGAPRVINVLGGKIDNVFDALVEVDGLLHQLA